jgi:hypothetical protein
LPQNKFKRKSLFEQKKNYNIKMPAGRGVAKVGYGQNYHDGMLKYFRMKFFISKV